MSRVVLWQQAEEASFWEGSHPTGTSKLTNLTLKTLFFFFSLQAIYLTLNASSSVLSWKHQSRASFNTEQLLRLYILALFSNQQDSLQSSRCKMSSKSPVGALTWISALGGTQDGICDSDQDVLLSWWGAESTQSAATPVQSTFHPSPWGPTQPLAAGQALTQLR